MPLRAAVNVRGQVGWDGAGVGDGWVGMGGGWWGGDVRGNNTYNVNALFSNTKTTQA